MEALKALLTRRSVRKFTPDPVPEEYVHQLLEAAMSAPSARNMRPWHFVLLSEREHLDQLADILPFGKMLYHAPLAIAVCGDRRVQKLGYWIQDCAAATENLLIAAHALGLGAVWLGVTPRRDRVRHISEFLQLPKGIEPLCVVALGFPAEVKEAPERFDPTRVHYEKW